MTTLPIYQIDAFTTAVFAGNPAAVVPLDAFLPDALMQKIALENNLSETAYIVPAGADRWELRWFTPTIEVPLCGHATLASAFLLADILGQAGETMTFVTREAGDLVVTREKDGGFAMRLPRRNADGTGDIDAVAAVLGARPQEVHVIPATDDVTLLAIFATEAEVATLTPDFAAMTGLPARNVIATAPGDHVDFVSRMFAPRAGIDEDPVTGSAHCSLAPYWCGRLGKSDFVARQISARGGDLTCRLEEDAVIVAGHAVLYLKGEIVVPG
ncbi:putative isomerase [Aureimonas sp. SA4125]|uniref:PhzF family phenazine biosynthesis protein n=1 Tax=Aureimonas sp. SA4125 TaxID=2826993 RepID=UPI001CC5CF52|nr:PhzF family phenazine biosynthesis protein [Aureimonas sp. SA4125]BDA85567.1 putative isomerase [Aureimonas sp. SA4125]